MCSWAEEKSESLPGHLGILASTLEISLLRFHPGCTERQIANLWEMAEVVSMRKMVPEESHVVHNVSPAFTHRTSAPARAGTNNNICWHPQGSQQPPTLLSPPQLLESHSPVESTAGASQCVCPLPASPILLITSLMSPQLC